MKYAAGIIPRDCRWMRVCALSKYSTIAFEAAKYALEKTHQSRRRLFVVEIEDFEYAAALKQLRKGQPYYVCLADADPLPSSELPKITLDFYGMHIETPEAP